MSRKRRSGSKKGFPFERDICYRLSQWWTGDSEASVFWRTSGSGGRATRRKADTPGHYGDVCSTDSSSAPLTDLLCLELKRGYSRHTAADLVDKPARAKEQTHEEWFRLAEAKAAAAGTFAWLVIHKRDQREAVVYFPERLCEALEKIGLCRLPVPYVILAYVPQNHDDGRGEFVVGLTLEKFLTAVTPAMVRKLATKY